ncbi:mucin-5AC-like [Carassius gibelio]|uniref:mucin-5AC-like n=1 Tax=Carassius gibelio TaxID=101364 RepID=UPI00227833BB|nr:mucin-5AC-like [Carassius gibelio]
MTVPWSLLWILGLICSSDSSCSPTSYYKSCWIRRYPGLYVDIEESQRRGAHILKLYQEESAVKCSRACCLTRNFSCNLAVYHFNTTQDSVNCFHLQCPNLESCIPHHRGNVILYNVTKGVDPDLLVFGKYFTTNVRVLPHMSSSRLNVSEPLTSDKRQFNYPPNPPVRSISPASTSTKTPTTPQQTTRAVPTVHQVQQTLPRCTTTQGTTTQNTSEHIISTTSEPKMDSTLNPQQTTSTSQGALINMRHTTTSPTGEPDTITDTLNQRIPTPSPVYLTTAHPSSTIDFFDSTLTSIPTNKALSSSTTQQTVGLKTTVIQVTNSLAMASEMAMQSSGSSTTLRLKTTASQNTNSLVMPSQDTVQSSSSSIVPLQTSTQTTPAYETSTWHLQTPTQTSTLSQSKETTSSDTRTLQISTTTNPTINTYGSTTPRYLTLSFTHTRLVNSATTSSLSSSLTAPTSSMVDSQPYPNDTKGYISRNITTGDAPQTGGDGGLMSVWHFAANTVLVSLATCATITFCCCCSVFVALSWRGRRRRKGRYRTNLRCKRGSMRLIKYVIVRESS